MILVNSSLAALLASFIAMREHPHDLDRHHRMKHIVSDDSASLAAAQDKDASPHIAVLRIQGPLCFANAARTKERILNLKVLPLLTYTCQHSTVASTGIIKEW